MSMQGWKPSLLPLCHCVLIFLFVSALESGSVPGLFHRALPLPLLVVADLERWQGVGAFQVVIVVKKPPTNAGE